MLSVPFNGCVEISTTMKTTINGGEGGNGL